MRRFPIAIILSFLLLSLGCARRVEPPPVWTPETALHRRDKAPSLADLGDPAALRNAVEKSLEYASRLPADREVRFGPDVYTAGELKESLLDFRTKLSELGFGPELFAHLERSYIFYESAAPDVLFTGYFEASLRGSLAKKPPYTYPIYSRPPDLLVADLDRFFPGAERGALPKQIRARVSGNELLPYYTREEIDVRGALAGKGLELVWVDNPVDAFFLQIQGSGEVTLTDGGKVKLNYAEANGAPYRSIGNVLVKEKGFLPEKINMRTLKRYLVDHPEEQQRIFNFNPSYVFFRVVDKGPLGSLQVPLTGMRSIATDSKLFPRGALGFISTEIALPPPGEELEAGWKPFEGFVLNQDTGGAIKGPGRVDLFTGSSKEAEEVAGFMRRSGKLYFMIKRPARRPTA